MKYSLTDFKEIKDNNFDYTIPNDARELITLLANLVGSPNYSKSPYFIKNDKKKNNKSHVVTDNWEMLRNFKTTELEKKTGIEQDMVEIRSLLNKLSKDNYDKIKQQIMEKLKVFDDQEEFTQVVSFLFSIASSNKFYSSLYATLYKDIVSVHKQIKHNFQSTLNGYIERFNHIRSCDPKEDYNLFCEINKENENRRAISSFIANLLLNNEVDVATVITLIFKLQQMLLDNIKDKMKTEEITENLFYLITIGLESIVITDEWGNIYDFMQSNSTRKDLSNKIRFRFMDMLDYTDKSM